MIELEVKISEKLLFANKAKLKLADSLFAVEICEVFDTDNKYALTLQYQGSREVIPTDEMENITIFLEEQRLSDKIEVSSNDCNFQNVSLIGEMKAVVYS